MACAKVTGRKASTSTSATAARASAMLGAEVEKLDSWFAGVSQPSRRIQDLVRRKRERHDALVRQLRQDLDRERAAAEGTVAFISANLRTELDKASLMVKLKGRGLGQEAAALRQQPLQPRDNAEALARAVAAASDVVQQLTEQRRRAVDAFYDLLLDVEAEHQKRAKAVLRTFGKALVANGHLPPHRLQSVMDSERKVVSELHLRHVISFGDLRLCLNMHAERDQRRFVEAVEEAKRQSGEQRQREALTAIQEARNKTMDEYIASTSMGRGCIEEFERRLNELKVAVAWTESYPFTTDSVLCWTNYVQSQFAYIDSEAKNICKCLTVGLSELKKFCINEIESLKDFLICGDLTTEKNFRKLHDNVCLPLMTSIDRKLSEDPPCFTVSLKKLLMRLTVSFDSLACLLRESGELWDNFCIIQESCREKTLQTLCDVLPLRVKCVQAKEQRIGKIIVQSKEETNKQYLHENVSRIFKILDEVKCSLENVLAKEKSIIEQHAITFDSEIGLFDPKIKIFLEKHEKRPAKDDSTPCSANFSRNFELIEAITQIIELEKERCGEEIFKFIEERFKKAVQLEEKKWIQKKIGSLEEEFNVIKDSHKLRYNTIQAEVETARLMQIADNERSLSLQKEDISKVSSTIQETLNETFVKELQIFKNFSSEIKTLQKKGLNDKCVTSVKSTMQEVEEGYKLCKETIKKLNNDFHMTVQEQVNKMKKNNLEYLTRLRHFSDGGTFSEVEITKQKSEIGNLELNVEALAQNNILSLKQKSKKCCTEAVSYITDCRRDLQLHMYELDITNSVTVLIQNTQSQIKKHTLALKYGGKLLTEQVTDLEDEENLGISDIRNKWRCVIQTVVKRVDCLLAEEIGKITVVEQDTSYKSSLIVYNKDNDFLSVIFQILSESLHEIEHTVEDFDSLQNGRTVPPSGVREEVKSFIKNIATKYRLYQEQCLDVWITELTVFLDTFPKLRKKYKEYSEKSFSATVKILSKLLEDEQSKLNKCLMNLRRDYQEHQVNVMAQFKPIQGFCESQYVFSSLCAEFEKTSSHLSENIKNLIEAYVERAQQYLQKHERDMKEHIYFIKETSVQLFDPVIIQNILQRIEKELLHLHESYTYTIAIDPSVFPELCDRCPTEKNSLEERRCLCPPELQISIQSLVSSTENFWNQSNQDSTIYHKPSVLNELFENSMKDAKVLVHNRTCEIKNLYEQYKNMAEELRMKWRYTLENIQQH